MQPKRKKLKTDENESFILSYTNEEFVKNQIEELYSGIKQSTVSNAEEITQFLLSLKPSKQKTIEEAYNAQLGKKSVWPLPDCFQIPNGKFKFFPPTDVLVTGGKASLTQLKSSVDLDLLLLYPDRFYQAKDYLNARYIVKRTLYLMHIITKLQKCGFVKSTKFKYLNQDVLKPVLLVKCISGESFNLIPSVNGSVFKQSFLACDKNALRPEKIFKNVSNCSEKSTPYYNSSILTDINSQDYLEFLSTISNSSSIKQTITILKFWIKRKGIGISGNILTTIVLHLFKIGLITTEMDVLTVLKQTWSFLSTTFLNNVNDGIIIGHSSTTTGHFGLFLDTGANILYNTCRSSLTQLAKHSRIMLGMLDSRDYNSFMSVLTEKVSSLFDLYDVVFKIEVPSSEIMQIQQHALQYCGVHFQGFIDLLRSVLTKSYGDRVKELKIVTEPFSSWSRKKIPRSPEYVMLGLSIDRDNWTRQVDRGPSADSPEAREFKEFWGSKSNMRRFQDGSIIQAVVWDGKTAQERRSILTQITQHVLEVHAGVSRDLVTELKFDSEKLVCQPYYDGDGEEQAQKIIKTFAEISKVLRGCSKIPLTITSVQGVSPVLRNTDLFPQCEYQVGRAKKMDLPNPSSSAPPYVKAHELIAHFELSGKWPEDVRAILRLKAAFYLALKEELESMHITAKVNPDFLDIARNGFIFRLRFQVPKEVKLRASNISFWVPSSSEDLKVKTEILPSVASLLTGFSIQYSAFPLTVRYLKHWVATQKLSTYIPDMFCELIVAHVFLSNKKYSIPETATAGFLRILSLLSSFDWNLYPILINFNDELTTETFEKYNKFMNTRKSFPAACIVCPHNEQSELTCHAPDKTSLNILKLLAEKSLSEQSNLSRVLLPDTSSYNVVIHLKRNQTGRYSNSDHQQEHHAKSSHFPVVEYEPVSRYVEELTQMYGYLCLFFYNRYLPDKVGVIMKRLEKSGSKFTVNGSMGKTLCEGRLVKDNIDALLSDFDLLGKGLVQKIEVLKLDV